MFCVLMHGAIRWGSLHQKRLPLGGVEIWMSCEFWSRFFQKVQIRCCFWTQKPPVFLGEYNP